VRLWRNSSQDSPQPGAATFIAVVGRLIASGFIGIFVKPVVLAVSPKLRSA
jgi:hypothetical protein